MDITVTHVNLFFSAVKRRVIGIMSEIDGKKIKEMVLLVTPTRLASSRWLNPFLFRTS